MLAEKQQTNAEFTLFVGLFMSVYVCVCEAGLNEVQTVKTRANV